MQNQQSPAQGSASGCGSGGVYGTQSEGGDEIPAMQPKTSTCDASTQPSPARSSEAAAHRISIPDGIAPSSEALHGQTSESSGDNISPLKSMPQGNGSARVPAQQDQQFQRQQVETNQDGTRRHEERSPNHPILPLMSTPNPSFGASGTSEHHDSKWGNQQQRQQDWSERHDDGAPSFSSTSCIPQQATPSSKDDFDIPRKVQLPADDKSKDDCQMEGKFIIIEEYSSKRGLSPIWFISGKMAKQDFVYHCWQ